jgi:hypothetical protein
MPNLTASTVHVDKALTNVSVGWQQAQTAFVADKVFPMVPSEFQTDKYHIWDRGSLYRSEAGKLGPRAQAGERGSEISQGTFSCDVWGVKEFLPEQVERNADAALRLREATTQNVTRDLLIARETQFVSDTFATSTWTTEYEGVASGATTGQFDQWDDYTNSTPISDINTAAADIQGLTGYWPNTLTIGHDVFVQLKDHPDIVDRIKYTERGIVTTDLLASLFGVDRVLVASAIKNSAVEGATDSFANIVGKAALLTYSAPNPGINVPTAGYTFAWTGMLGSSALGSRIRTYDVDDPSGVMVQGEAAFDFKVVAADLGAYLYTAVA